MAQLAISSGKLEYKDANLVNFTVANENWVQNLINKIGPCLVATVSNLTATYDNKTNGIGSTLTNSGVKAALVIDGEPLIANSRVVVKNQTNSFENGIYTVTNIGSATVNWVLTRVVDYEVPAQMIQGNIISVISGTENVSSLWMLTSNVSAVGTSNIIFNNVDKQALNSIVGTLNQLNVSVINGIVTINLVDNVILPGNKGVTIPAGPTSQRDPNSSMATFRFNTEL